MKNELMNVQESPVTAATLGNGGFAHRKVTRLVCAVAALAIGGAGFAQGISTQGRDAHPNQRRQALPGSHVSAEQRQALARYNSDITVKFGDREVPAGIMGLLSSRVHPNDPSAEAQAAIDAHRAAFRLGPEDSFTLKSVDAGDDGGLQVHMLQKYRGVPVDLGELTVYLTKDQVVGISGHVVPDLDLPQQMSGSSSAAAAALAFASEHGLRNARAAEANEPVVYTDEDGDAHLAIPVDVTYDATGETGRDRVFVDGNSGRALGSRTLESNAAATPNVLLPAYTNFLRNPGFESGDDGNWTGNNECTWASGTIAFWSCMGKSLVRYSYSTAGSQAHSGFWNARLGGNGRKSQDRLCQQVTIPAYDLVNPQTDDVMSFYLSVITGESGVWDYLYVQIQPVPLPSPSISAGLLFGETLATYSNAFKKNSGYSQVSVSIPYKYWGRTVNVCFVESEDISIPTTFLIDDVRLGKTYSGPFPL